MFFNVIFSFATDAKALFYFAKNSEHWFTFYIIFRFLFVLYSDTNLKIIAGQTIMKQDSYLSALTSVIYCVQDYSFSLHYLLTF